MIFNSKMKLLLGGMALVGAQLVNAQTATTDEAQLPVLSIASQEVKPAKTARVVIEWATFFDGVGMTKTEISVDQVVVCKINKDAKICDIMIEPGKREIALYTSLDFGSFSERYDLEAGKRYKLEVVMNKKNFIVDSLFLGLPVSAIFNKKGKTATLKFELTSVGEEPSK